MSSRFHQKIDQENYDDSKTGLSEQMDSYQVYIPNLSNDDSKFKPEFSIDKIKVFLRNNDRYPTEDESSFQKNSDDLQEVILKQTFLEKNKLFNPTEYFGGLVISDLSNYSPDQRLEAMFDDYLPTEEDLNDENKNPNPKPSKGENFSNNIQKNTNKNSSKQLFSKKVKTSSSSSGKELNNPRHGIVIPNSIKKNHNIGQQSSADKLKYLFKDQFAEKSTTNYSKNTSLFYSKGSINISSQENQFEKNSETDRNNLAIHSISKKPPKFHIYDDNSAKNSKKIQNSAADLSNSKLDKLLSPKESSTKKLLGNTLSPRFIPETMHLKKKKSRNETLSAERKPDKEPYSRMKEKNFFSFTHNTLPDEEIDSQIHPFGHELYRPKTANPSFVEESTPVIKGLISPKFCKTPQIEGNKSLLISTKPDDKKVLTTNPLKFFNDFLNKSKLNNNGSSNHLKMPKKYTFIESKNLETPSSHNDNTKGKSEKTSKSTIQNCTNVHSSISNFTSAKRLFTNKICR